ncbi:MAG: DEAD/DEAH box helicase [Odoribacter sp.]
MEKIITDALIRLKIDALNEMQIASLQAHTTAQDLILLSPTGSGKTLAFLLPLLAALQSGNDRLQAIIITPSRELALQIESVFRSLGSGFKICCCYGGHPAAVERCSLAQPTAVVVGTPGRLLDHIEKRVVDVRAVSTIILDEFDKSLEFGFQEEMSAILEHLTGVKRRVLTSATQAIEVPDFVGMSSPLTLDFLAGAAPLALTMKRVVSPEKDKLGTLYRLLCQLDGAPALIFCNYRESAERVSEYLAEEGVANEFFHGGLEQDERERALAKFRNGSANLFISTDLASRGLDIPEIKYIIHYQLPPAEEAFIHRNGRTARMNASGTAYVLVSEEEYLPEYMEQVTEIEELKTVETRPAPPRWVTLYIGKGKKDKLSKGDIVGFLCQKGDLQKEEIGTIEVRDYYAFAAVARVRLAEVLHRVGNEKIKGMRTKIEVAD